MRKMAQKTLAEVATLLEETLEIHKSVTHVVLSTKEGVVVASVCRENEMDSKIISTVAAALVWAGATALDSIGSSSPAYLVHSTAIERIITILQPNYLLVVIISNPCSHSNPPKFTFSFSINIFVNLFLSADPTIILFELVPSSFIVLIN